jgi:hypothetical protein
VKIESDQNDLSPTIHKAESFAMLIDESKLGNCGLGGLPPDFGLLRWNRQMWKRWSAGKAQENRNRCEQPANAQP